MLIIVAFRKYLSIFGQLEPCPMIFEHIFVQVIKKEEGRVLFKIK